AGRAAADRLACADLGDLSDRLRGQSSLCYLCRLAGAALFPFAMAAPAAARLRRRRHDGGAVPAKVSVGGAAGRQAVLSEGLAVSELERMA
ncbi:hypothetical protein Tco_0589443, partial [Tanacetum coccineum]